MEKIDDFEKYATFSVQHRQSLHVLRALFQTQERIPVMTVDTCSITVYLVNAQLCLALERSLHRFGEENKGKKQKVITG